jgi:hypothetical protein
LILGVLALGVFQAALHAADSKPARLLPPSWTPLIERVLETPPRSAYESSLMPMVRSGIVPDVLQQICSQWFPAHGRDVADAYVKWRARNDAMLKDVATHATALWARNAGPDNQDVVPRIRPYLRKKGLDDFMYEFDSRPAAEFERVCIEYPTVILSPEWDLEKKFRRELAVMRKQPLNAAGAPR